MKRKTEVNTNENKRILNNIHLAVKNEKRKYRAYTQLNITLNTLGKAKLGFMLESFDKEVIKLVEDFCKDVKGDVQRILKNIAVIRIFQQNGYKYDIRFNEILTSKQSNILIKISLERTTYIKRVILKTSRTSISHISNQTAKYSFSIHRMLPTRSTLKRVKHRLSMHQSRHNIHR